MLDFACFIVCGFVFENRDFFFSRRFKWILYQHFLHTVLPKTVRNVRYDQSKIRTEQSKLNDCCKYSSVWLGVLDEFWYLFIVLLFVYFLYNADLETQLNHVFFLFRPHTKILDRLLHTKKQKQNISSLC